MLQVSVSTERAARAAMLTSRFSDIICKAGKLLDHDIKKPRPKQATARMLFQREEQLRRRREDSRRKLERMKPTATFDNSEILKEFSALCGCPSQSLPYRFEGSSSLEKFGLRLRTFTYDDIEEAVRLDDAERDIEEGEIV
ncbi:transcription factor GTE9-like protein [Corchorus capsularis]|uniref:Transcription factor GTE9-like protein n=1 Tax=Corchorus capsularis TaxID=210143 RepID=A0A1R3JTR8_COCAP|nr:transcription factor GTE9-like protein [Corchorus capsularis]